MESQPIKAELLRVDCVYLCTQPVTFLFETAAQPNNNTKPQNKSPLERETENDGLWQFSRPEVIFSMQKLSHTMCIYPKIHHTQQRILTITTTSALALIALRQHNERSHRTLYDESILDTNVLDQY